MNSSAVSSLADWSPSLQLSSAEWLARLPLDENAPATLVRAARGGKWERFLKHALKTLTPKKGRKSLSSKQAADQAFRVWTGLADWLCRVAGDEDNDQELAVVTQRVLLAGQELIQHPRRGTKPKRQAFNLAVAELIAVLREHGFDNQPVKTAGSLTAIITCGHLLWTFGTELPAETALNVLRAAVTATLQTTRLMANGPESEEGSLPAVSGNGQHETADEPFDPAVHPVQALVRRILWPLCAHAVCQGFLRTSPLAETAKQGLEQNLRASLDNDGSPQADLVPELEPWCALLLLAGWWRRGFDKHGWSDEVVDLQTAGLLQSARLLNADGHLLRSSRVEFDFPRAVSEWMEVEDTRDWEGLPQLCASHARKLTKRLKKAFAEEGLAHPIVQSDWGSIACLRPHWTRRSPLLLVTHQRDWPEMDLHALGRDWLTGSWDIEVFANDEPLALSGEWSCVCWHSDDDVDYIELQCPLSEGYQLERQILLARQQEFLLLADSVSGGTPSTQFECQSQISLADGVAGTTDQLTRESQLVFGKHQLRVFPLALPDERLQKANGVCEVDVGHRRLQQQLRDVGGLMMPLILDWKSTRRAGYAEWQRLTVAENGQKVGSDRAVGFRLRVGNYQLLFYRSFANGFRRTVLGQHTPHETLIGEVKKSGNVHQLLVVEGDDPS